MPYRKAMPRGTPPVKTFGFATPLFWPRCARLRITSASRSAFAALGLSGRQLNEEGFKCRRRFHGSLRNIPKTKTLRGSVDKSAAYAIL